jgi:hypothetical protein
MRWLCLRACSEVRGDDLSDILRDLGVPRTTFYPRTTALALRVVRRRRRVWKTRALRTTGPAVCSVLPGHAGKDTDGVIRNQVRHMAITLVPVANSFECRIGKRVRS